MRNDELLVGGARRAATPDNVVISPGPGRPEHPRDVGVSLEVLRRADGAGARRLPRPPGARLRRRRHGRARARGHARAPQPRSTTTGARCSPGIPQGFLAVRYHSLVVGVVPPALRVTAWTPDGVIMALEHRARPLFGVQFHPESVGTAHGRALLENFRDLDPARRARPRGARAGGDRTRGPAAAPRRPARARSTAAGWTPGASPRRSFGALFADHEHAVWLDSSRSGAGRRALLVHRRARRAARPGRRATTSPPARVAVERASGREVRAESVLRLLPARARAPARGRARSCRSTSSAASPGYLGYELKAECGGRASARLAAARRRARALRPADRLRPPRAPRPPARARRRRRRARRPTRGWRPPTRRLRALAREPPPLPPAPAAAGHAALRAARRARGVPGQHRRLPARDLRGRELRGLPDDRAAQRRRRSTRCAAYRTLRARNPAPFAALLRLGERLGAELLARAVPARRPRPRRRVAPDEGHRGAGGRADRGRLPRGRAAARRARPAPRT